MRMQLFLHGPSNESAHEAARLSKFVPKSTKRMHPSVNKPSLPCWRHSSHGPDMCKRMQQPRLPSEQQAHTDTVENDATPKTISPGMSMAISLWLQLQIRSCVYARQSDTSDSECTLLQNNDVWPLQCRFSSLGGPLQRVGYNVAIRQHGQYANARRCDFSPFAWQRCMTWIMIRTWIKRQPNWELKSTAELEKSEGMYISSHTKVYHLVRDPSYHFTSHARSFWLFA